jgi:aryl-alcohol dehydrogenase-like predicted oxidoreductase
MTPGREVGMAVSATRKPELPKEAPSPAGNSSMTSTKKSRRRVNPENTFDYTPALIQFVLSNRLVDVALVGMRTVREVESCVGIWKHETGRIDIDALWHRFIADQQTNP